ncbi:Sialoadhesin Sheep erythrocyte receptor [Larimichthys crocea]|uniref:Sialoadhesin Sheep erythrocyte receptor n=1 Tax=Larimichthys crocea TaxID=215358 RepID=A0A6G0JAS5_LARCR|nr:Sialoadhesin Sheep erythrocyte receptor [Larimichthys crocea]
MFSSPDVPRFEPVSVSPSGEIVENSSVTLTCSSDANPAVHYTWYKNNGGPDLHPLSEERQLIFRSIQSSDSGEYYCTTGNLTFLSKYISLDVKYPPRLPSVSVSPSAEIVENSSVNLTCSSDANPAAKYTWYKENEDSPKASGQIFTITDFRPEHSGNYYCEAQNRRGRHNSTLHLIVVADAPKLPSVSVSPSAEIVENSSVNLTCSSDANPAANYTWYKKNGDPDPQPLSKEAELVFRSIQSSDSGEYYCTAENELGRRTSESISVNVKYAPKLPSVSVSPSAEIVENSSVTLTCNSDANPAAKYTWYKEKQKVFQGPEGHYNFMSISPGDTGNYTCKSENQYGKNSSSVLFIDVQYPPRLPSVSVSPSAEILEGSSVTLTCSSDANPAAKYTWYKENEDSPKASGQIFTITDITPEHSGNYYCEAQNMKRTS